MSLLLSPLVPDSPAGEPAGEGTRLDWLTLIGGACLPAVASYLVAAAALAIASSTPGTSVTSLSARRTSTNG